jgi:aminoglycoside N3'-acetyltransferase
VRTVAELADDLAGLGVQRGDTLMVHASLRRIGPVDGGADGVIDALHLAIGEHGTLLMTLGARDDWGWVNDRPEGERAALLRDAVPFDPSTTPADPDNGVLAEVFRARAGTLVSDHPEGRFGARGSNAAALVADVPWDDYYGPGSPLERLVDAGGRVLRLGADPDTVTLLHHAEYLAPVRDKRRVRRHRMVQTPGGVRLRTVECLDDSDGIAPWAGEDYFAVVLREYLATGRAATGTVGDAASELIDAADIVAFGAEWMGNHLADTSGAPDPS